MLKPVSVKITGDDSQFQSTLVKAGKSLKNLSVIGAGAAAAVVGGLAAMTRAGLANVDALGKAARAADATANGLLAVQMAAGDAGVSVEEVNSAVQKMNQRLVEARQAGTPAAKALEVFGLRAQDVADLDVDERLELMADRAKDLGLTAGQVADALRDLGVRSANMSTMLMAGGDSIRAMRLEAEALGLTLTEEQIVAVEQANDALAGMSDIFTALQQQLAVKVAPTLKDIADRFQAFSMSEEAQQGIQRLSDAFASLVEVVGSAEFMEAVISGMETAIDIATALASGLVSLSQNIELVTAAASIAAIALAAMGGPITAVVAATGLAVAGFMALKEEADALEQPTRDVERAQKDLTSALEDFSRSATPANQAAVDRAAYMLEQAKATLAAAEAEEYLQGVMDRTGATPESMSETQQGLMDFIDQTMEVDRAVENTTSKMEELNALIESLGGQRVEPRTVGPYDTGEGGSSSDEDEDEGPLGVPGLGGAEQVAEELEARLESIQNGLMTEQEWLDAWYQEGASTLEDALANKLITEQQYLEQRNRLEREYAKRSEQVERMRQQTQFQIVTGGIGEILSATSQGNAKLLKANKAFGAGMALVDTLAGASRELRKGTFGFASAAAVIAKGFGFISAIKGVSESGGSGPIGGGGSSSSGANFGGGSTAPVTGGAEETTAPPAAPQTQNVLIDLVGASGQQVDQFQSFANTLNETVRQGLLPNIVVRGA